LDVIIFRDGKTAALYVFLDSLPASRPFRTRAIVNLSERKERPPPPAFGSRQSRRNAMLLAVRPAAGALGIACGGDKRLPDAVRGKMENASGPT